MQTVLMIVQLVIALLMVAVILMQEKGSGFGEAIGGTGGSAGFQTQKRGAEKVLAQLTVALVILFMGVSLVLNFV